MFIDIFLNTIYTIRMSRISRYKESIDKFFKTKSFINDINPIYKNNILDISSKTDYFISVVLLTVMNNISKKILNVSLHGYFMASSIESLFCLNRISENKTFYNNTLGDNNLNKLYNIVISNIYKTLSQNIDTINIYLSKEKLIKINNYINKYITNKLELLLNSLDEPKNNWITNDLIKYKLCDKKIKDKLSALKVYSKNDLLNYIDNKLGNICKITLVSGYILGGGDEKNIPNLEKLAVYMAQLIKVASDFNNIEEDLNYSNGYTYNTVITLGYQEAFELFQTSREKFVEGTMILEIHTNTIKEIIDLLEERIDKFIDNTATQSE